MTRRPGIDVTAEHRRIVIEVLRTELPGTARAWVFGSRATGRARTHSDLDLAIDAGRPLSLDDFARLSEAFSDSDLPYRVDVVDWNSLEDDFRRVVSRQRRPLDKGLSP